MTIVKREKMAEGPEDGMEHFRRGSGPNSSSSTAESHMDLLQRGIRLNTLMLGVVMGLGAGIGLFLFTHLSILLTGESAGQYLNLLGIFFPGYTATVGGAWYGLLWGFVAGAVSGGFVYYVYARSIGPSVQSTIALAPASGQVAEPPVLKISGNALGLALGLLMALQLYLATAWLIVRGTAGESIHAALLVNYFPGYSVSYVGGLFGAAYIFVFTYIFAMILASIYNWIVAIRAPGSKG